jgi:hypothetical protein
MEFKKVALAFVAAFAAGFVFTGCTGDVSGFGTLHTTCTSNATCGDDEICHPTSKVCVRTCTGNASCPGSAPTCRDVGATGSADAGTQKVCGCSATSCNNGRGEDDPELICSTLDEVCVQKCTSNAACGTGRTCNTTSGQCEVETPQGAQCTFGQCQANEVCQYAANAAVGNCAAAPSCTGTGQSTCAYGQFCNASGKCQDVPTTQGCENFDAHPSLPTWQPTTGTGPIIYRHEKLSFGTEASSPFCASTAPVNAKTRVHVYRTEGTWPTDKTAIQGFFYVRVNGTQTDATQLVRPSGYVVNGQNATFDVNFCLPSGATTIQFGLYFTNGNEYCGRVSQ